MFSPVIALGGIRGLNQTLTVDELGWVVGLRSIVCLWDLGLLEGEPAVGVFLRDLSPHLH